MATTSPPLLRSWVAWLSLLWLGLAIHVDWHLARPGHHEDLSFHSPFHWIIAVIVFGHLAWLVARRWGATHVLQASLFIILGGAVLGQGIEPFWEVVEMQWDWSSLTNLLRWKAFIEFMIAGLVTYLIVLRLALRSSAARALP